MDSPSFHARQHCWLWFHLGGLANLVQGEEPENMGEGPSRGSDQEGALWGPGRPIPSQERQPPHSWHTGGSLGPCCPVFQISKRRWGSDILYEISHYVSVNNQLKCSKITVGKCKHVCGHIRPSAASLSVQLRGESYVSSLGFGVWAQLGQWFLLLGHCHVLRAKDSVRPQGLLSICL